MREPVPRSHITALGAYPVCAVYRFEIPLRAMIARSWCTGTVHGSPRAVFKAETTADGFDFRAGNPVLVQRHIALDAATARVLRANACAFVHDMDDLLWAIPADNPGADEMTPELLEKIDGSLRLADLVTASTEPLAAALEQRGIPTCIIPNLIDPADWTAMPVRGERSRLRVGWYGQRNLHVTDLDIIAGVVEKLSTEIDFVFYGDFPRGLASSKTRIETHQATPIDLFPAMLAKLDLDILLSPLAKNAFNECKSNLRLLQAGVLGYSVIATDIEPHRTLPVTRIENTLDAWVATIRERIGERDAVWAEGRKLQRAVNEKYTIDETWAERIFTTWTRHAPPDVSGFDPIRQTTMATAPAP